MVNAVWKKKTGKREELGRQIKGGEEGLRRMKEGRKEERVKEGRKEEGKRKGGRKK